VHDKIKFLLLLLLFNSYPFHCQNSKILSAEFISKHNQKHPVERALSQLEITFDLGASFDIYFNAAFISHNGKDEEAHFDLHRKAKRYHEYLLLRKSLRPLQNNAVAFLNKNSIDALKHLIKEMVFTIYQSHIFHTHSTFFCETDGSNETLFISYSNQYLKKVKLPKNYKCYYALQKITYPEAQNFKNTVSSGVDPDSLIHKKKEEMQRSLLINNVLAKDFERTGNYKKALFYATKCYELNLEVGDSESIFKNLIWLGEIHFAQEEFSESIVLGQKALEKYDSIYDTFSAYRLLGNSYFRLKNYGKAKHYQRKALIFIEKAGIKKELLATRYGLFEEFAHTNFILEDYKTAYDYYNKFFSIEEEFLTAVNQKKINDLQVKFKVKEKEIELQNLLLLENAKEIELQKHTDLLNAFWIILVVIFLLSIFIFVSNRSNKRKNSILRDLTLIIEADNRELELSQDTIGKTLEEKKLLLREMHYRVKNNLQLILSFLSVHEMESEFIDVKDFLEKGQSRIIAIALIHSNLDEREGLDRLYFLQYVENLIHSIKTSFAVTNKKIDFDVKVEQYFDIKTSVALGLIIHEIVCNSLRHAFQNNLQGVIYINVAEIERGLFKLHIGDDGSGVAKSNNELKWFNRSPFKRLIDQIDGSIVYNDARGVHYTLSFLSKTTNVK